VDGHEVYLRDVWPTMQEIEALLETAFDPLEYRRVYADLTQQNPLWNQNEAGTGRAYKWDPTSLYIREPPYFDPSMTVPSSVDISGARALAIFGDSITTDHISPAGAIHPGSSAGGYLREQGVSVLDFNSYGARRGNHEVMVRGTFANVRIRNLMVPDVEGGVTRHQPGGERMGIYDAAERYRAETVPVILIAGLDYGAGSSRDWAAKGTRLLGVRAVIARGFERIHRSNLIGMGVFPCQFPDGVNAETLGLDGTERFDLEFGAPLRPRQTAELRIERRDGRRDSVPLVLRIDTPIEAAYFSAGGILPYVLEQMVAEASDVTKEGAPTPW
jgi:aconitate hydratase